MCSKGQSGFRLAGRPGTDRHRLCHCHWFLFLFLFLFWFFF